MHRVPSVRQIEQQENQDLAIRRIRNRLALLCVLACLAILLAACGSDSTEQISNVVPENEPTDSNPSDTVSPVQITGDQAITTEPSISTDTDDDHSNSDRLTVRFTSSNEDIWPPQPLNMTEVTILPSVIIAKTNSEKMAKVNRALLADSKVRAALGDRFEVLASREIKNKTNVVTHVEAEIYNYQADQVITVQYNADNETIIGHTSVAAYKYQPPESQTEVSQAIALAEEALSTQGFTDHRKLRGTGLLAFPTAIETAESGHQFYSERKIYVTFGGGNGELPQYRALVNISTSTVESSGAIQ